MVCMLCAEHIQRSFELSIHIRRTCRYNECFVWRNSWRSDCPSSWDQLWLSQGGFLRFYLL